MNNSFVYIRDGRYIVKKCLLCQQNVGYCICWKVEEFFKGFIVTEEDVICLQQESS